MIQTTLPRKLKAKYPHLKIYCYPRGFNPVVFRGNPAVEGIQRMPFADTELHRAVGLSKFPEC